MVEADGCGCGAFTLVSKYHGCMLGFLPLWPVRTRYKYKGVLGGARGVVFARPFTHLRGFGSGASGRYVTLLQLHRLLE